MTSPSVPEQGDIQIDADKSEWIVIGATNLGVSRVKRNSLAHKVHAESSPAIAKSFSHHAEETSK
jgi:hypothetical protein